MLESKAYFENGRYKYIPKDIFIYYIFLFKICRKMREG